MKNRVNHRGRTERRHERSLQPRVSREIHSIRRLPVRNAYGEPIAMSERDCMYLWIRDGRLEVVIDPYTQRVGDNSPGHDENRRALETLVVSSSHITRSEFRALHRLGRTFLAGRKISSHGLAFDKSSWLQVAADLWKAWGYGRP